MISLQRTISCRRTIATFSPGVPWPRHLGERWWRRALDGGMGNIREATVCRVEVGLIFGNYRMIFLGIKNIIWCLRIKEEGALSPILTSSSSLAARSEISFKTPHAVRTLFIIRCNNETDHVGRASFIATATTSDFAFAMQMVAIASKTDAVRSFTCGLRPCFRCTLRNLPWRIRKSWG